jgi:hypothetical protein
MAAIVPISEVFATLKVLRSAVGTSQTDWIAVPAWAKAVRIDLAVTAAGTSTILTILDANPAFRDDTRSAVLFQGATITAASDHIYEIARGENVAPNVTADTDSATLDARVRVSQDPPSLLGLQIATVGGPTYTLSIEFIQ